MISWEMVGHNNWTWPPRQHTTVEQKWSFHSAVISSVLSPRASTDVLIFFKSHFSFLPSRPVSSSFYSSPNLLLAGCDLTEGLCTFVSLFLPLSLSLSLSSSGVKPHTHQFAAAAAAASRLRKENINTFPLSQLTPEAHNNLLSHRFMLQHTHRGGNHNDAQYLKKINKKPCWQQHANTPLSRINRRCSAHKYGRVD